MKNKIIIYVCFFICLLVSGFTYGQKYPSVKYPFDLSILERFATFKSDTLPKYHKGKFYFVNRKTGKKIFKTEYDIAYPFVGKSAVVNVAGRFGVIDKKGNFIIKPSYPLFKLPSYENYIAIFSSVALNDSDTFFTFDLYRTKENCSYIGCEKSAVTEWYSFIGENKKYGIKNRDNKTIIDAQYDEILFINFNYIVAKQNSKIGIIDQNNRILVPFEYDELANVLDYGFPNIIGLKKENSYDYFQSSIPIKRILTSQYACHKTTEIFFKQAIGIFEENNKYNILFKDGTTLANSYDWISGNGLIAIEGKKVYIINDDKSRFLYYEEQ